MAENLSVGREASIGVSRRTGWFSAWARNSGERGLEAFFWMFLSRMGQGWFRQEGEIGE
jgi:hypothetical protein